MDINQLLKGIDCKCGKRHECRIQSVYVEKNAINRLQTILADYNKVLIVADENTYGVCGEKVLAQLNDKQVKKVIFSGATVLVPNEDAISMVEQNLADSEIILAVGSGVIQDLCKYVSHFNKIPYIDVATAPSMDGYASDGAAMILGGMKETVKAGLPISIIADTEVLRNALNDWKISNLINGEYLCDFIYDLTFDQIQKCLSLAQGLKERREDSIKSLMDALVVIGILMSFAGSSRPASGSEHHLSHFFEITGIVENKPYLSHGLDVAYSTVITAKVREELLKIDFASVKTQEDEDVRNQNIKNIYGCVAQGCIDLQKKIGNYAKHRYQIYAEKQTEIKNILKEMPSSKEIEDMLSIAGLDISEFYTLYGNKKIADAVKYAKDLKDRFTVLWLNYDLRDGKLDE